MTMRDKIAAIVHEHETIGVDHWGAADAILDEFPELTETQMDWEARIKELEAALVNIAVEAGKSNGTKERILCLGRIALKGEET